MITLLTNDGVLHNLNEEERACLCDESGALKNCFNDVATGSSAPIQLTNVSSSTLKLLLETCAAIHSSNRSSLSPSLDDDDSSQRRIYDLWQAANFLEAPKIMAVCCEHIIGVLDSEKEKDETTTLRQRLFTTTLATPMTREQEEEFDQENECFGY